MVKKYQLSSSFEGFVDKISLFNIDINLSPENSYLFWVLVIAALIFLFLVVYLFYRLFHSVIDSDSKTDNLRRLIVAFRKPRGTLPLKKPPSEKNHKK